MMAILLVVGLSITMLGASQLADGQRLVPVVSGPAVSQAASGNTEVPPVNQPSTPTSPVSGGDLSFCEILVQRGLDQQPLSLRLVVEKTAHTLAIYHQDQLLKVYPVDIGDAGLGDKQRQGDHKTPEGSFYITERSILQPADEYLGSRWFRLSYPNIEDAERGLAAGLIDQATHDQIVEAIEQGLTPPQDTALGGGIGIHGGAVPAFGSDWTFGCVGLSNQDIEEFFNFVAVGTEVEIRH